MLIVILAVAGHPPEGDPRLAGIMWSVVLGVVLIGVVWPFVEVSGVRVMAQSPTDLTVGDEALIDVAVDVHGRAGRLEIRALDPLSGWFRCGTSGSGQLPHLADRRGIYGALRLEVRSSGLVGVLQVERQYVVALPREVSVGPRPVPVRWVPRSLGRAAGELAAAGSASSRGDVARSVRPYVVGDPAHLVHWPSSARTGGLVVREMEPPATTGQAIVVDLRAPAGRADLAELAASRAAGLAQAVLGAGGRLLLITNEGDGPVVDVAATAREVRRRLARAAPGEPPAAPPGWPVEIVAAQPAAGQSPADQPPAGQPAIDEWVDPERRDRGGRGWPT